MKEWMTPAEIAGAALEGAPKSKRSVQRLAMQQSWSDHGVAKARFRQGKGGGWEYHISCLPEVAQADWQARREAALAVPQAPQAVAPRTVEPTTQLSARRRKVMEARAQVLSEIKRREMVEGVSQRKAILSLIEDFKGDQTRDPGARLLPSPVFQACIDANDKGRGVSARGIYRWCEHAQSGGSAALAPKSSRPAASNDAWPWLPRFLRFYCRPQKPSIKVALEDFQKSGLINAPVSYDQARRALASLSGSAKYLDAHRGREGSNQLKARMAFTRRDTSMLNPCDVYIGDGKTFDAEIAHPIHGGPFKPEITSILDVATRRCVGWSVDLAESSGAVADAMRMAVTEAGIPAIFYSDRGPGYANERFDGPVYGLCARLGTTTTHSLPYNSQARGIIERFNGTCWNPHAQEYASYLGAPMDREAKQMVHRTSRSEMKAFGESRLICGWERFVEQATQAVAEYNARPHSALRIKDHATGRWVDRSPDQAWADAIESGLVPYRPEADEIDDLFRPVKERTARRGEVQYLNNIYFHQDLVPYDGLKVLVGYDMHDASKVWVRAIEQDGAIGPLICVAVFAGNSTDYMPRSTVDAARERRHKGRSARLAVKQEAVDAELRAPMLVEHSPAEVLPEILSPVPDVVPIRLRPAPVQVPPQEIISEDVLLAGELLRGELEMTEGRYGLMVKFLRYGVGDNLLKCNGLDAEALREKMRTFKSSGDTPK